MKLILAALALLTAGPAGATQEYVLPTLFSVTGVAADDVLNVRAKPSASAETISSFAPDRQDIEVVAHDASGGWAQVNVDGRSGWVSLRYLAYQVGVWDEGRLPRTFHCVGTEPFWSLTLDDGDVVYATPEVPKRRYRLDAVLASGVFRDPRRALVARGQDGRLTASVTTAACSDGMSDRVYGLDVSLIRENGAPELLRGCCSIAP
ncbi:COG3650 family protein [Roseitranquillus sediminis]|uniref:COG3650 family protein n=1 Tax=Roseitranquillus sediminis TaxID=2809051 RepID=UPI001D0C343F|nr:SH3 domain-containing protein [Roseitranquillus sediminis]MBM9593010.1 SH3 domain-containing protein [Roseitranquillus sediminis]